MKKFKILGIMLVLSCFTGFSASAMEDKQVENKPTGEVNKATGEVIDDEQIIDVYEELDEYDLFNYAPDLYCKMCELGGRDKLSSFFKDVNEMLNGINKRIRSNQEKKEKEEKEKREKEEKEKKEKEEKEKEEKLKDKIREFYEKMDSEVSKKMSIMNEGLNKITIDAKSLGKSNSEVCQKFLKENEDAKRLVENIYGKNDINSHPRPIGNNVIPNESNETVNKTVVNGQQNYNNYNDDEQYSHETERLFDKEEYDKKQASIKRRNERYEKLQIINKFKNEADSKLYAISELKEDEYKCESIELYILEAIETFLQEVLNKELTYEYVTNYKLTAEKKIVENVYNKLKEKDDFSCLDKK